MDTNEATKMFLEDCNYRNLAPKTIESYQWAFGKLAKAHSRLPNEPQAIKRLIASQPLAQESKHDLWRNYRAFYHWLERQKLSEDIMKDVPAPATKRSFPRTLGPEQISHLFRVNPERRDRAMLALPLNTSMRVGELANMRWQDVGSDGIQVDGKTGPRFLPISPQVRQAMVGLGDHEHIWVGKKGPLTSSGVKQAIRRCLYRAGIRPPKAGAHLLRHTFGRMYILNGGDVFSLQRLMGHRRMETTMIYVYMSNRDLIEQHRKYDPLKDVDILTGTLIDDQYQSSG